MGVMQAEDPVTWPVRTQRLSLRRAVAADVDGTWPYRRLGEVVRWMTSAPATREEYRARFEEPERLAKTLIIELRHPADAVAARGSGVVVGDLMLAVEDGWAQTEVADRAASVQAEIGWCLDPAYAGRGFATEAVEALLRVCFENLALRRVTANCFADNERSWRLMERVGMRREAHTVRESLHRSGQWLDGLTYAMLAEEWRTRRC
jgi:RimJ/RimL family protein N-acetyltransferase